MDKIDNILETEIYNCNVSKLYEKFDDFTSKKILYDYYGKDNVRNLLVNKLHVFIEYNNKFLRSDKLIYDNEDKKLIRNAIITVIKQNDIADIEFVYKIIKEKDHRFLLDNLIFDSSSFYNVLECIFHNEFFFNKPFISDSYIQVTSKRQLLLDYLNNNQILYIDKIYDWAHKINFEIINIFEIIDSTNRIFVNKEKTIYFVYDDKIDEFVKNIEKKVYNELIIIDDTIPFIALESLQNLKLPYYDWDEWYIYSLFKKNRNLFDIKLSTYNYKKAVPFISIKGHFSDGSMKKWLNDNKYLYKIHIQNIKMEDIEESIFLENLEDFL